MNVLANSTGPAGTTVIPNAPVNRGLTPDEPPPGPLPSGDGYVGTTPTAPVTSLAQMRAAVQGDSPGDRLADQALLLQHRPFKRGQTRRCADFVSTMVERAGVAPPGFEHQMTAERLASYGQEVPRDQLQRGDVIYFGNTYRRGDYTHVGIYIGDGQFIHRPTANKPVRTDQLDGYWSNHFTEGRRLNPNG